MSERLKVKCETRMVSIDDGSTIIRIDRSNAVVERLEVHIEDGLVIGVWFRAVKIRSKQKMQGWLELQRYPNVYSMAVEFAKLHYWREEMAILAVIKTPEDQIESVSVFVRSGTGGTYESFYGNLEICQSYRNPYVMIGRSDSGFYTGIPLEGESFTILPRVEAIQEWQKILAQFTGVL